MSYKVKSEKWKVKDPEALHVRKQIVHCSLLLFTLKFGESKLGRLVDALALGGDEGRDKLR